MATRPVRRVWVQNVAVGVRVLETRLDVAAATGLGPDQQAAAEGVRKLLRKAEDAACGIDPKARRLGNWWGGTLAGAAYQNLHAARAQIVDVYDDAEMAAEIPIAIARSQMSLHRDDPRRLDPSVFDNRPVTQQRAMLRRAIEDGYDAMDLQHDRLRSFRNIILLLALFIAALIATTIVVVSNQPDIMPLCFDAEGPSNAQNCPTGTGVDGPSPDDVIVVSLLGLLGGALAAAVSIRNLRGTSTPYDLPVALATLKVPLGAFTAVLGLVAIQGNFVPGLSELDSQEQILAYALLLGFGQQVFTHALDRRAQNLLEAVPSKDASTAPVQVHATASAQAATSPPASAPPSVSAPSMSSIPGQFHPGRHSTAASPNGGEPAVAAEPTSLELPLRDEPQYLPPPDDDDDVVQDDGSITLPSVPVGDHR